MYKIHVIYDEKPYEVFSYSDALDAFQTYLFKCVDVGFAKTSATYNLELPNGKMYTKNFVRGIGFVGGK